MTIYCNLFGKARIQQHKSEDHICNRPKALKYTT